MPARQQSAYESGIQVVVDKQRAWGALGIKSVLGDVLQSTRYDGDCQNYNGCLCDIPWTRIVGQYVGDVNGIITI
jgi:hypothetical protein